MIPKKPQPEIPPVSSTGDPLEGRSLTAREEALGARELGMDARENASSARELGMDARENASSARELGVHARESASSSREGSLSEREHVARLRDEALSARREADEATAARDALIPQLREANERLILATLRAEEAATAAHLAQLETMASEERFRTLVTTSAAIVFRAGPDGRVHMDPASWRAFTGREVAADDDAGDEWLEAVHPADRERVREAWTAAVLAGSAYAGQHRLERADGSDAWVAASAVPIPTEGPTREWLGTLTDISDRIRIEEAREQFIAILGHDLRAPLSVIVMANQLMAEEDLAPRQAELVRRIVRGASRMEGMIGALLDFARGRLGGGIPIERAPCDLASICADAVSETQHAHPDRTIVLETSGDLTGSWDRDRLEQVLTNLLRNAVQHGRDPIRVGAHGEGERVVVTVQNAGAPILADLMPTLFEPFHQRALGSKAGLGLGLYIAAEIVRSHGGRIGVGSTEGEGTTLTVELPRRAAVE